MEAIESGHPVYGVKGNSVLSAYISIIDAVPVDYMHALLEGVPWRLLSTCLDSKTVQACLLMAVFDLPARAIATNFVQFNGYYSCTYCLDQENTHHTVMCSPLKQTMNLLQHWTIWCENGNARNI